MNILTMSKHEVEANTYRIKWRCCRKLYARWAQSDSPDFFETIMYMDGSHETKANAYRFTCERCENDHPLTWEEIVANHNSYTLGKLEQELIACTPEKALEEQT